MNENMKPDIINNPHYLAISFSPRWEYLRDTRHYIENFLMINSLSPDMLNRLSISILELLDNAVRYADDHHIRLDINHYNTENKITIKVSNTTAKKKADRLLAQLREMNKTDPLLYYVTQMERSRSDNSNLSGLGIARINYETKADISAEYNEKTSKIEVNVNISL